MRMHLLSGGRLSMPRAVYHADAGPGERIELPVSCALFRHPQGVALFDTGCHPDAAEDPEGRWGKAAQVTQPIFRRDEAVVGQLPHAGLTAEDVDLVICSHLHFDHCGCNSFFRRATVICHAQELAAARADAERPGYLRPEWDVAGQAMQAVEGEHDVFGDGRLTLVPLPGHTPGTMGIHVVLDWSGPFLLPSDAAPLAACLTGRSAPRGTWDVDRFLNSLDTIAGHADGGAKVLFSHDDAQWRSIRTGAAYYD